MGFATEIVPESPLQTFGDRSHHFPSADSRNRPPDAFRTL
jgi:hypothetical protein